MYFQRQGCAAKGAFGQQSADQPMTMAAAGTMVILIGAIHDVIAAHDRIENGFACVDGIGMHGRCPPFRSCKITTSGDRNSLRDGRSTRRRSAWTEVVFSGTGKFPRKHAKFRQTASLVLGDKG